MRQIYVIKYIACDISGKTVKSGRNGLGKHKRIMHPETNNKLINGGNKMDQLTKFDYLGTNITFQLSNGQVMVNATEMAKAFGKRVPEWTRLQSTKDFLDELWTIRKGGNSAVQKMHYDIYQTNDEGLNHILKQFDKDLHLIVTTSGGQIQGTWVHEDVALEFARWLSPSFAIWCNDHIKQMLTTGQTSLGSLSEDQKILQAMQILQQRVEITTKQLEQANSTISNQAPKVSYYDEVLQSESLITVTVIAKDLGMSAQKLNKILHEKKIIFQTGDKENRTWVLYERHQNKGYTKTKTHKHTDDEGIEHTKIHTYWTEAGRKAVIDFIVKNGLQQKQKPLVPLK